MQKVECDNCGWVGTEADFPDDWFELESTEGLGRPMWALNDLGERLDPGSEVPVGDCPECQCFCYFVAEVSPLAEVAHKLAGRVRASRQRLAKSCKGLEGLLLDIEGFCLRVGGDTV